MIIRRQSIGLSTIQYLVAFDQEGSDLVGMGDYVRQYSLDLDPLSSLLNFLQKNKNKNM